MGLRRVYKYAKLHGWHVIFPRELGDGRFI